MPYKRDGGCLYLPTGASVAQELRWSTDLPVRVPAPLEAEIFPTIAGIPLHTATFPPASRLLI